MLDINFIREHADLVKDAARKKHVTFDVAALIKADDERRTCIADVEKLRRQINEASARIAQIEDTEQKRAAIDETRTVKAVLETQEKKLARTQRTYDALMLEVPNIPDPSVPEGKTDAENVQIRTWGEVPQFTFTPKSHMELLGELGLVDAERGAKVSGFRGLFFKGDALRLQLAIWMYAVEFMAQKGFVPLMTPALVREENLIGTGWFPAAKDDVYKTQDELYLSGTAEVATMGYHAGEMLDAADLPKKYVAFSPCYRREVGSYGKDTKGAYRVHEFNKVEQVVLCEANHQTSVALHEEMTAHAEALLQSLHIPYRVVVNCGGDLGLGQVKKYDIESWMPSRNAYGETHSASYFHDFQARRLNITYRNAEGEKKFVHSLNNTVIATPRILIALLENHQREDGSIAIPEPLKTHFGKAQLST